MSRAVFGIALLTGVWGCPKEPAAPQTVAAIQKGATLSRETVQEFLCGSSAEPCTVTDLKPSGDSTKTRYVVEVAYLTNPDAAGEWKQPKFDAKDGCNRWALFAMEGAGTAVRTATKLVSLCNDGYGASGVGEDHWSVEKGQLTVTTNGGSNWRWGSKTIYDLATKTVVYRDSDSYFSSNPEVIQFRSWDYGAFAGKTTWTIAPCGASNLVDNAAWSIAALPLPEGFVKTGWKTTALGSCASSLDARGDMGFVIHGQKSTSSDTTMKVVAAPTGDLFVEVLDDLLVASSTGKWIHADHLEVWLSFEEPEKMNIDCVDLKKGKTWQWGIDANDGTVHVAHGKPSHNLVAEHVSIEGGVRFKVSIPPEVKAITVIYSDSDDGKSQERLLATSTFKFANLQTMGEFTTMPSDTTSCVVEGAALVSKMAPLNPETLEDR